MTDAALKDAPLGDASGVSAGAPAAPLVKVRGLKVAFVSRDSTVQAVNGVDFDLARGEVLTILGESGSGKSVTMRALMKLLPKRARLEGEVEIDGEDVMAMSPQTLSDMRGQDVAMIFQEPMVAFDPVFTVGAQIAETVERHMGKSRADGLKRARELFDLVQIPSPERRLKAYPHELSGGMRQRAMIALALACSPKLLLADEPTTALDATVQIQILLLLRQLQRELGMSVIFVTHDVGVAMEIADRLAVMYAGRMVESGSVSEVINSPSHPYTRGLLRSTVHGASRGQRLEAIPGSPPDMSNPPPGCPFAPRCPISIDACVSDTPAPEILSPGHQARCFKAGPEAAA